MLFERIRHQDVVFLGVAVIRSGAAEVIDSVVCVAGGTMSSVIARGCHGRPRGRRRRSRGSLLRKEFWCSGYESSHGRNLAKKAAPSIDLHDVGLLG